MISRVKLFGIAAILVLAVLAVNFIGNYDSDIGKDLLNLHTHLTTEAEAQTDASKTTYPAGRQPAAIKNGVYPDSYFPNTELLGPDEMRITALGTGMPNVTKNQASISYFVELGNGDKFLFDLGGGSFTNLMALRPDFQKVDKVFASHLHTDHIGDFPLLLVTGWLSGRYTPVHIYGPSGATPELGTKAFADAQVKAWAWDIKGRSGVLPDAGGKVEVHEFDYKGKNQVIYDQNGVVIGGVRGHGLKLMSDNGSQPTSLSFMKACSNLEVEQVFTSYNNPKGNADTERMIRTMKEELFWLREWKGRGRVRQGTG